MTLKEKLKSQWDEAIIFLKDEKDEEKPQRKLYTKKEKKELYGIKKGIERFK